MTHPNSLRRSPRASLPIYLLAVLTAFLTGCLKDNVKEDEFLTHVDILCTGREPATRSTAPAGLDVFVFDMVGNLDSYMKSEVAVTDGLDVTSGSGERRLVAISGGQLSEEDIIGIRCYDDLYSKRALLSREEEAGPAMTGETVFLAGEDRRIVLEPLFSEVVLSSLECEVELNDPRVWLAGVSAEVQMLRRDGFIPTYVIDTDKVPWKGEPLRFACGPNDAAEETPGTPWTRLIVEGEIDGETVFYPFTINRKSGSGIMEGIERNARYTLDITLTGWGLDDPSSDVPVQGRAEKGSMTARPGQFITGHDGERLHVQVDVFPEDTEVSFDMEDLEFDRERGIYDYELDPDGKGVWLTLLKGGAGAFIVEAGKPVDDGLLVIVVVNP